MAAEKENVITHTYDLLKYVIPQLEKFPRSQKFVLADKIQTMLTDIMGIGEKKVGRFAKYFITKPLADEAAEPPD